MICLLWAKFVKRETQGFMQSWGFNIWIIENWGHLFSSIFLHVFSKPCSRYPGGTSAHRFSSTNINFWYFCLFLSIFVTETRRAHGINPRTEAQLFLLLKGRFFYHSGWFCRHEWLCMIPGSRIFNVDNPRRNLEFKVLWIFSWDIGSRQICGNARCNLKNCSGRVQNRVGEMKFWGHLGFEVLWLLFSRGIGSRQFCGNARCNAVPAGFKTGMCEMKSWSLRFCGCCFPGHWFQQICGNAQCILESCSGKWSGGKKWQPRC